MAPKFANPHSLSQDVEKTTRSEIAERAGLTPNTVHDEESRSLKRDLDALLQDAWANTLANASKAKKPRNAADRREPLTFRLVSSMKHPQPIFLDSKLPSAPVSREPNCEDDETQAETRKIRSYSVALEPESLVAAVRTVRTDRKPIPVEAKVALGDMSLAGPLPPLLVAEEVHARGVIERGKGNEGFAASPHEPRPCCAVLPVMSVPDKREKRRRRAMRERPPPAYWRPPGELRGKCMGYALGYPSSWAPDKAYVRDTMKRGV